MKASIRRFNVPYSSVVAPYWNNAVTKGFLSPTNLENFDSLENNSLERSLGYIFFNTLRARLSNERGVSHRNLQIWQGGVNNVTGFVCPKPWKYEIKRISAREYGCFYLDCVQMGEYFYDDNGDPIRNYDKIRNQRRVPYMKVCYTDGNREMPNDFVLNIDHLLQDDTYLVELSKVLHDLKTDYLDPFITFQTQTSRNLPPITYWKNRADYLNVDDNNIDECKCLGRFLPPTAAGNIIDHTHDDNNKIIINIGKQIGLLR
ncbi:MAG: hypothetical protein NMK33_06535 (plasmid) [Candidatus Cardinium sp.]|uniref:hypothetical protein n=1 Tax=Cardinium endosymbiont of Dermatophagoides farinae TaxID=2597823 RepID=UPI0011820AA3|nr:hypothetical protein [Cardinium endosymbiont of Dermatophagoides farinae]TSJ79776.1 hypothetical protein FPG78_06925 [Cardinium endosymbiont of Dermatophagoides farinae]UWW97575.1 MAG: hypothetical protein NMK33_06535 [Candidatus Cardinium sp.]